MLMEYETAAIETVTLRMNWEITDDDIAVLLIGPFKAGFVCRNDKGRWHVFSGIPEIDADRSQGWSSRLDAQGALERATVEQIAAPMHAFG